MRPVKPLKVKVCEPHPGGARRISSTFRAAALGDSRLAESERLARRYINTNP